jgi:glycosyltransferase involved in cell wall biosynthesis
LKIIILIELNPFFTNSAAANRWLSLIEGLKRLGVEIELVITGGYNNPVEWKLMGFKGTKDGIQYSYLNFLFHHNIWLRRLNNYFLLRLLNPLIFCLTKSKIRKSNANIIWTSNTIDNNKIIVALKKEKLNHMYLLEMSEFLDIHHNDKGNKWIKKRGDTKQLYFESEGFFAYDLIVLMTKTLYNHYKLFPDPKPKLLHLPMTVDLFRFDKNMNTSIGRHGLNIPYVCFVGVMNNAKDGVDILINAFAKISPIFPDLTLYLFGFHHYDSPGHLQLIKMLGLEDKIFYKGAITREEIPNVLMSAELLALPRPDSKQAQGGFPTKLGEYLATGKPVCVTKVGEIPDYLKDEVSAFMADPGDVDSFANSMIRALTNPELAKIVGENGRKVAEQHFNMGIQAEKLYHFLYENIENRKKLLDL